MSISMTAIGEIATKYGGVDPEDDEAVNAFLSTMSDNFTQAELMTIQEELIRITAEENDSPNKPLKKTTPISLSSFDIHLDELKKMNQLDALESDQD